MLDRSAASVAMTLVVWAACESADAPEERPDGRSLDAARAPDAAIPDALAPDAPVPEAAVCPIPGCPATEPSAQAHLRDVWIAPNGEVWAVGTDREDGLVGRRSPDVDWCWCTAGVSTLEGIWGSAPNDVWMVGAGGTILRYDGEEVAPVYLDADADLRGVWGSAPDDVWVVGAYGLARHFDGTTWSVADVGVHELDAVWGASSTDVWIGGRTWIQEDEYTGEQGEVLRWDPGARVWNRELLFGGIRMGAEIHGLSGSGADNVWAVGVDYPDGAAEAFSTAYRFDGVGWHHELGLGITPEELVLGTFTDVAVSAPGAEAGCWIVGGGVGGEPRGALRFDGATWSEADPEVTFRLQAVDARDGAMWAVGLAGKVARWTDSGWVSDREPPGPEVANASRP